MEAFTGAEAVNREGVITGSLRALTFVTGRQRDGAFLEIELEPVVRIVSYRLAPVSYTHLDEIALFCNGTAKMSFCWNASAAVSNKASLAEGIDPLPMAFPSDDGVPELCGGIWGFGIFDNGDEAKAAAAKEFIKFVCDDAEQGPQSVYATGFFPVRASFGDIYTGTDKAETVSYTHLEPYSAGIWHQAILHSLLPACPDPCLQQ